MNNTSALPPNNPRPIANSVADLITTGLGYCCEHFFWTKYLDLPAPLIAARLGVSPDTIRRHKQWYREGRFSCSNSSNCLPLRRPRHDPR